MKRAIISFFILIFIVCIGFGQERKFQVSIFGALNHVFEYGSEDAYVLGENDFPVTPSHYPAGFGISFVYLFSSNMGIEIDGRYYLSSKVTLEDPSDQDTIEIDTSKHYSITLNFISQFPNGKIIPYVVVGGGIDKILGEDETYTSEYGYEIEFLKPEKTIDPISHIGAGMHFLITPSIGTRMELRYVLLFTEPNNVSSFNVTVGVTLRF